MIIILTYVATTLGLFWGDRTSIPSFITAQGQFVLLYGQGLYAYDTIFVGAVGLLALVVIIGILKNIPNSASLAATQQDSCDQ
ncbi:MAG: hypothetical protein MUF49_17915 [Oculatellaceae cyanobacterium Prado106]|nr:hypothetical protein [Oculatellaceae cyanobacterium Prado106]